MRSNGLNPAVCTMCVQFTFVVVAIAVAIAVVQYTMLIATKG